MVCSISHFLLLFIPSLNCVLGGLSFRKRPATCPLRLASPPKSHKFVLGGTKVDKWSEFLRYNAMISIGQGMCSGSLISDQWVLTAAHCGASNTSIVRIGGTKLWNGENYQVSEAINHPKFTFPFNDIALLRISKPVEDPQYLLINSNFDGPHPRTIVRATGYGVIGPRLPSYSLRMVDNLVISTKDCKKRLGKSIRKELHVCTWRDKECKRGGTCTGDSGGPLVARISDGSLLQIGITAGGNVCGDPNSADIFTRVSHYIEWIQETTGNAAKPVKWNSINNVGSVGDPGDTTGADLKTRFIPLVHIYIIIACVLFLGIAVIVYTWFTRRHGASTT